MKNFVWSFLLIVSCAKQPVHPPVGGILSQRDLTLSKNRAKQLNEMERRQIEEWIAKQPTKFEPMSLNYWTDVSNLRNRERKADGAEVSYSYILFDFNLEKLSPQPIAMQNAVLGKFEELKAVEDAVRYLNPGEKATLLVPSVLAYGTYGNSDNIDNDMPLIIKLTIL